MSPRTITMAGVAALVGLAIYAHLSYRSRKLRSILHHPALSTAQAWARRALAIGGVVAAAGLLLMTGSRSQAPRWQYPMSMTVLVVGLLLAFAGAFMVGYTADGPPNER